MKMTYRGRRRLRKLGVFLGITLAVALVALVCWFLWLGRFVVYSADGAKIRLGETPTFEHGVVALPPENPTVAVHYNEGEDKVNTSSELTQISGAYATTQMLVDGVDEVDTAIQALPSGSAVMLDLKSIYGNFYYSTNIPGATQTDALELEPVDSLIQRLDKSDRYLIARVPAFRDRSFGLENTNCGLPVSGGYLWADDENCYWLNPTSSGTLSYLISIAEELRDLGFDEVVFTEFRFPSTDQIIFDSSLSRSEALAQAAKVLVSTCATEQFAVSFETDDEEFALPEGRTRLYLTDVSAAKVQSVLDQSTVPVKESQLVFITETNDTRFDVGSVIRPLSTAPAEPAP